MSQGRFLFVPETVPPKMFMFIGFFLARKKGSWKVLETAFEKVLRRVLRRCLAVGLNGKKGFLEGVLRRGFREGT